MRKLSLSLLVVLFAGILSIGITTGVKADNTARDTATAESSQCPHAQAAKAAVIKTSKGCCSESKAKHTALAKEECDAAKSCDKAKAKQTALAKKACCSAKSAEAGVQHTASAKKECPYTEAKAGNKGEVQHAVYTTSSSKVHKTCDKAKAQQTALAKKECCSESKAKQTALAKEECDASKSCGKAKAKHTAKAKEECCSSKSAEVGVQHTALAKEESDVSKSCNKAKTKHTAWAKEECNASKSCDKTKAKHTALTSEKSEKAESDCCHKEDKSKEAEKTAMAESNEKEE